MESIRKAVEMRVFSTEVSAGFFYGIMSQDHQKVDMQNTSDFQNDGSKSGKQYSFSCRKEICFSAQPPHG